MGPQERIGVKRRAVSRCGLALAAGCLGATVRTANATPSAAEAKLIESLIDHVGAMSQAVFIRNGASATAAQAAAHLRDKYDYYRDDIATAEDFIRLCGTRSVMSGRPYSVRMPDGTERPTAVLLEARLRELRARS